MRDEDISNSMILDLKSSVEVGLLTHQEIPGSITSGSNFSPTGYSQSKK